MMGVPCGVGPIERGRFGGAFLAENIEPSHAGGLRRDVDVQGSPAAPWVFCNPQGERIASIKKGLAAAVRRAGIHTARRAIFEGHAGVGWFRNERQFRKWRGYYDTPISRRPWTLTPT